MPATVTDYRVEVDGTLHDDPYRYPPDARRAGPAPDRRGAARAALGGARRPAAPRRRGARSRVWAPNARGVRVVGDFTGWGPHDGLADALAGRQRRLGAVRAGRARPATATSSGSSAPDGQWREKADPMAARTEVPPATASVVAASDTTRGATRDWLARRAARQPHQEPMSVYEVHLGSWRPGLGYRELAEQLTAYVVELGFTHVEFLPVMEHPFGGSWGYQVTGYYAPTARFGDPDDFRHLVDRLHAAGIGVILDWVPAHFPQRRVGAGPLRRHPAVRAPRPAARRAPRLGHVRLRLRPPGGAQLPGRQRALLAATEFHVDGLRVDAVASMLYLDYSRSRRPVDAQPVRRAGEPGGDRVPAGGQRDRLQAPPGRADDRRGVDGLAGGHPADLRRRAGLRLQVEHGLDARHPALHRPRTRSTASTTTTS